MSCSNVLSLSDGVNCCILSSSQMLMWLTVREKLNRVYITQMETKFSIFFPPLFPQEQNWQPAQNAFCFIMGTFFFFFYLCQWSSFCISVRWCRWLSHQLSRSRSLANVSAVSCVVLSDVVIGVWVVPWFFTQLCFAQNGTTFTILYFFFVCVLALFFFIINIKRVKNRL